jgi:hypothetical protein
LKLGAQKEKADDFGLTPLMMAAQHKHTSIDVLEALLEAGASVRERDQRNQTVLYKVSGQVVCSACESGIALADVCNDDDSNVPTVTRPRYPDGPHSRRS